MNALEGIKIISFNHFLAGPAAAQLLGDLGADVIAVEPLDGAFQRNWGVAGHFVDGQSVNHISTGRNKRSIAVDMKSAEGKALVHRLIEGADVVMENFRPGAMARLGFGADDLLARHPRLVYAAATGFGATGPYADRPGQDLLLQAMSGLAAHTGRADGPPVPVGSVVIDQHAAALYVMGIVTALFRRERTGKGGRVDVSLLQAAIDLQGESITAWLNGAPRTSPRGPGGVAAWFSAGGYGIHRATDGFVAVSMAPPAELGKALGVSDLQAIDQKEAFTRREEITAHVGGAIALLSTAEAVAALDAAGIWNAIVEDYDDLPANPQLQHLETFRTVSGATGAPITMVGHPLRYDGEQPPIRHVPQPLGAQTREILAEAGFDRDEVERLLAAGVIRTIDGTGAAA